MRAKRNKRRKRSTSFYKMIFWRKPARIRRRNLNLRESMMDFTWNQLSAQQQQEWHAIPLHPPFVTSLYDFTELFISWEDNSYYRMNAALQSGDPGQILSFLYLAGVFTNWLTNQIFFYTSFTAAPDKLAVIADNTHIAFGSAYQFFLQNGKVIGYQIGTNARVNLATPLQLPSTIANHLP